MKPTYLFVHSEGRFRQGQTSMLREKAAYFRLEKWKMTQSMLFVFAYDTFLMLLVKGVHSSNRLRPSRVSLIMDRRSLHDLSWSRRRKMMVCRGRCQCADSQALGGKKFCYQMVPVISQIRTSASSQMSIYATPK